MAKVIYNGEKKLGAYTFPDRKKVALAVDDMKGNVTVYGYFNSKTSAENFMEELADIIGAERIEEPNEA